MILEFHASFDAGDLAWMLFATVAVVVLYLPGLALFYCGML